MILDLKNGMTSITIFHGSAPLYVTTKSIADKSDRLKAVVLTYKRDVSYLDFSRTNASAKSTSFFFVPICAVIYA